MPMRRGIYPPPDRTQPRGSAANPHPRLRRPPHSRELLTGNRELHLEVKLKWNRSSKFAKDARKRLIEEREANPLQPPRGLQMQGSPLRRQELVEAEDALAALAAVIAEAAEERAAEQTISQRVAERHRAGRPLPPPLPKRRARIDTIARRVAKRRRGRGVPGGRAN